MIDLQTDYDEPLSMVTADTRRLKQILINLLSNAVKFTPAGGSVTVEAWARPGLGAGFRVIDPGIGIAKDDQARMLEPFTHVHSDPSRKHEGTGLGLPHRPPLLAVNAGPLTTQQHPPPPPPP